MFNEHHRLCLSHRNCSYSSKIRVQKRFLITLLSYFLVFITYCQQIIIIYYALVTTESLTSFDYPLSNIKLFAFLIVNATYVYNTIFPLFALISSSFSPCLCSRCFSLFGFTCFHLPQSLCFSLILSLILLLIIPS